MTDRPGRHIKALALASIALALIVCTLALAVILTTSVWGEFFGPPKNRVLAGMYLGLVVAVTALASAVGLFRHARWARVLTLATAAGLVVAGLLTGLFLPLALYTVYAFWVLTRPEVRAHLASR